MRMKPIPPRSGIFPAPARQLNKVRPGSLPTSPNSCPEQDRCGDFGRSRDSPDHRRRGCRSHRPNSRGTAQARGAQGTQRCGRAAQGLALTHVRHLEARGNAAHDRLGVSLCHSGSGINGAGKTTTIANWPPAAGRRTQRHAGRRRYLSRAAREQLEVWAERNQCPSSPSRRRSPPVIFDGLQPRARQHRRPDRRHRGACTPRRTDDELRRSSACSAPGSRAPHEVCWCSTAPSARMPSRRPKNSIRIGVTGLCHQAGRHGKGACPRHRPKAQIPSASSAW